MSEEILKKERRGRVGILTINRPQKGNSLTVELLGDLVRTLSDWAGEDEVRAVVITAAGERAFSSGFDVTSLPTRANLPAAELFRDQNPVERGLSAVREYPYPVIAMLNGAAVGAGFGLAMACDLRLAADHVRMGIPPARLGIVYYPEGMQQIVEVIGLARARELFFTGRVYAPEDVARMGLVHGMVPRAELAGLAFGLAEEIARNAPLSLKGTKQILNLIGDQPGLSPEAKAEADRIVTRAFLSEDAKEGQLAFLQKRQPVFTGK